MCGIFGVFGPGADPALAGEMARILQHRGPDGSGKHVDRGLLLGNVRLKVIDLATGDQPIYDEEGSRVIVYNGEIYNYRELRSELEGLGHRFHTESDTEVALAAYTRWGVAAFERFNGMFAMALWDATRRELVLARDRHGIKPLFLARSRGGDWVFASEVKALLLHPGVERRLDLEAFHLFVNLRYLPAEKTMFAGITKLAPGTWLRLRDDGLAERGAFGQPRFDPLPDDEDALVERLRTLLTDAVRSSLVADVPVGMHLSGGLDSTAIVAVASRLSKEPLKTFCMGFGEATDEIEKANRVADHFGTDHRDLVVKSSLFFEYPKMIWHADAPKRNLYPYFLSELTSKRVKVALTGLGGDELLGGYVWKYQFAAGVADARRRIPPAELAQFRASASNLLAYQARYGALSEDYHQEHLKRVFHLQDDTGLYLEIQTLDDVLSEAQVEQVYGKALREGLRPVRHWYEPLFRSDRGFLANLMWADYRVKMVDDFLFVDDAMSMAHSVENRPPFLDNRLVDFAFRVPPALKWRGNEGKRLLRKAVRPWVPDFVLDQPKHGFGPSSYQQFRERLYDIAVAKFADAHCVREGLIQKSYLDRVLTHPSHSRLEKHYSTLWNLLAFEIWYDLYFTGQDVRRPKLRVET